MITLALTAYSLGVMTGLGIGVALVLLRRPPAVEIDIRLDLDDAGATQVAVLDGETAAGAERYVQERRP